MKHFFLIIFLLSSFIVFSQTADNLSLQIKTYISSSPKTELSETEKKNILSLIEEEKLAHDVYVALFKKWNLRPFNNISNSEQTHIDSLELIIKKYDLEIKLLGEGKFNDLNFLKLYDDLVNNGKQSAVKAYQTGALVEELDISDIQKFLKETDNKDLKIVYLNLIKGSRNHLRTFHSQLKNNRSDYSPKYLTEEEFLKIVNSKNEAGFLTE
jgi:hypothetical protein